MVNEAHPDVQEVIVGVLGRPHGIKGDVVVELRTDEPDRRFAVGAELIADGSRRRFTVSRTRWISGRLVVTFDELPDRTAVEQARGLVLLVQVPVDESPTTEDEFYIRHLIGLRVRAFDGTAVGTVSNVQQLPAQDLLVIDADGTEILVPFVRALVPEIDMNEGWLQLADVDGLLDIEGVPDDGER